MSVSACTRHGHATSCMRKTQIMCAALAVHLAHMVEGQSRMPRQNVCALLCVILACSAPQEGDGQPSDFGVHNTERISSVRTNRSTISWARKDGPSGPSMGGPQSSVSGMLQVRGALGVNGSGQCPMKAHW